MSIDAEQTADYRFNGRYEVTWERHACSLHQSRMDETTRRATNQSLKGRWLHRPTCLEPSSLTRRRILFKAASVAVQDNYNML